MVMAEPHQVTFWEQHVSQESIKSQSYVNPYTTPNFSDNIANPDPLKSLAPLSIFEGDGRLRKGSKVLLTLGHIMVLVPFIAIIETWALGWDP